MFTVLGHLIQVMHLFLCIIVMYHSGKQVWKGTLIFIWLICIQLSNIIFGGCIITLSSNKLLQLGGQENYQSITIWLSSFIGNDHLVASFLFIGSSILASILGLYIKYKQDKSQSMLLN